jgi:hypothetical protein
MPKFREAGVLVDAGGAECPSADAGGDFAVFEVAEEFSPFGVGGGAVFVGGPQGPAAGEEGQVGLDRFVGVDGLVAEGDVDVAVSGDDLGDVRGKPVHDRVGEEDPAEIMGSAVQRGAVDGVGQAGADQGAGEDQADGVRGEGAVLGADLPLEQDRGGRQPGAFVVVVDGDQGYCPAAVPDPGDDGAEHVG